MADIEDVTEKTKFLEEQLAATTNLRSDLMSVFQRTGRLEAFMADC